VLASCRHARTGSMARQTACASAGAAVQGHHRSLAHIWRERFDHCPPRNRAQAPVTPQTAAPGLRPAPAAAAGSAQRDIHGVSPAKVQPEFCILTMSARHQPAVDLTESAASAVLQFACAVCCSPAALAGKDHSGFESSTNPACMPGAAGRLLRQPAPPWRPCSTRSAACLRRAAAPRPPGAARPAPWRLRRRRRPARSYRCWTARAGTAARPPAGNNSTDIIQAMGSWQRSCTLLHGARVKHIVSRAQAMHGEQASKPLQDS
jgi:hypothetical protein